MSWIVMLRLHASRHAAGSALRLISHRPGLHLRLALTYCTCSVAWGSILICGLRPPVWAKLMLNWPRQFETWKEQHPNERLQGDTRWQVIGKAAAEVGPALFFSLLIITLSFLPVFTLEAQEGRLFGPLAFTKTYAMAAAGLSVTLVPVLMGYWIRGHIPNE